MSDRPHTSQEKAPVIHDLHRLTDLLLHFYLYLFITHPSSWQNPGKINRVRTRAGNNAVV